jgi:hypothetical protein
MDIRVATKLLRPIVRLEGNSDLGWDVHPLTIKTSIHGSTDGSIL